MTKSTKLGSLVGTAGIIGGIFYATKNNKTLPQTAMIAVGLGIVGVLIGNAVTKFYE